MKYQITDPRLLPEHMAPSSEFANSIDLRACIDGELTLWPDQQYLIPTGFKVALPYESMGMIIPRSGLGTKGLVIGNLVGNIDPDYRGEIKVCLWNRSDRPIIVNTMDRIAQFVVVSTFSPTGWEQAFELLDTARGEKGFGSTGVK